MLDHINALPSNEISHVTMLSFPVLACQRNCCLPNVKSVLYILCRIILRGKTIPSVCNDLPCEPVFLVSLPLIYPVYFLTLIFPISFYFTAESKVNFPLSYVTNDKHGWFCSLPNRDCKNLHVLFRISSLNGFATMEVFHVSHMRFSFIPLSLSTRITTVLESV